MRRIETSVGNVGFPLPKIGMADNQAMPVSYRKRDDSLSLLDVSAEILEMGIHGGLNSDQARAVSRIQQGKEHLLRLINEVLDYSRLEAGVVELEISRVPLLELP